MGRQNRSGLVRLVVTWYMVAAVGLLIALGVIVDAVLRTEVLEQMGGDADDLFRLRVVVFGAAALAALLGFGAVAVGARRVTRPLRRLTASVDRIAGGELDVRVSRSRLAEVDQLGMAVNTMAEQLGDRVRESEQQLRIQELVLSSMEEGVILINEEDQVDYANRWVRDVLGPVAEQTSGLTPPALARLVRTARTEDAAQRGEVETIRPRRLMQVYAVPLDQQGRVLVVLRDITESQRMEAMRRDFVADASHELKTPIAAIQAGSETIIHAVDEDPEAARRFAEQVRLNTVRLGRIVSDLLDLSRLETKRSPLEEVRLGELVEGEVSRIVHQSGKAPLGLSIEIDEAVVKGNRDDLRLAVRNLLDNAQRYSEDGEVRVSVRREGSEAVVEITDTGIGIPTRDLPRVFERFYRVDVARSRHTGGTGLGLAIVKHVMEGHGGRVEVESELGVGSTFRMLLPLIDTNDDEGYQV